MVIPLLLLLPPLKLDDKPLRTTKHRQEIPAILGAKPNGTVPTGGFVDAFPGKPPFLQSKMGRPGFSSQETPGLTNFGNGFGAAGRAEAKLSGFMMSPNVTGDLMPFYPATWGQSTADPPKSDLDATVMLPGTVDGCQILHQLVDGLSHYIPLWSQCFIVTHAGFRNHPTIIDWNWNLMSVPPCWYEIPLRFHSYPISH